MENATQKLADKKYKLDAVSLKGMKKHKALAPLFGFIALGSVVAGAYVFRLATQSPDVSWNKVTNPEPWNKQQNKQYKFYSTVDYSKFEIPEDRPKI